VSTQAFERARAGSSYRRAMSSWRTPPPLTGRRAGFALAVALVAALAHVVLSGAVFGLDARVLHHETTLVVYNTPIGFAFVLWWFDVDFMRRWTRGQAWLAAALLAAALVRVLPQVPLYSGHALFVAFALSTARTAWLRGVLLLVGAQVVVTKLSWRDDSWALGLALGAAAGAAHRALGARAS